MEESRSCIVVDKEEVCRIDRMPGPATGRYEGIMKASAAEIAAMVVTVRSIITILKRFNAEQVTVIFRFMPSFCTSLVCLLYNSHTCILLLLLLILLLLILILLALRKPNISRNTWYRY